MPLSQVWRVEVWTPSPNLPEGLSSARAGIMDKKMEATILFRVWDSGFGV